ncbi:hypothetical protein ACKKBF_B01040 [Auxenochlorella protothecoides x Auxenochlorella symbiontica]
MVGMDQPPAPGEQGQEHTWFATLREVKHQFCLYASFEQREEGGWVDLDPAETAAASDPHGSSLWPQHQWHAAFEILFALPPDAAAPKRDDMLFFVYLPWLHRKDPVLVRRRGKELPADLSLGGALAGDIDWRASALLSLVMHTRYTLTVMVSGPEGLSEDSDDQPLPPGAERVNLEAWPSTSRFPIDVDGNLAKGSQNPIPTYPDICFEVSTFDTVFKSQILRDGNTCYSVLLHARVEEWRCQKALAAPASHPAGPPHPPPGPKPKVCAFSGFVTQARMVEAGVMGGPLSVLGPRRAQRVLMNGPGGEGRAEVAVLRMLPPGQAREADRGKGPLQKLTRSLGQVVRQVASEVGAGKGGGGGPLELQCSLILLSLPVQSLTRSILDAL